MSQLFDYIIVGAGVHGLSTAYYLAKQSFKIAIIESSSIPCKTGSSHGQTRIIRAAYQKQFYRDFAKYAIDQVWPQISKQLNSQFIAPNPFIYLDQTQAAQKLKKVVETDPTKSLSETTYSQVHSKYPNFIQSKDCYGVVDKTAGIVMAQQYISKIHQYLKSKPNVLILQNTKVIGVYSNSSKAQVVFQDKLSLQSKSVVVSVGSKIGQLIPQVSSLFKPILQMVCYLQLKNPQLYKIGKFPSFVHISEKRNFFGLPQSKNEGVKIGEQILKSSQYEKNREKRMNHMQNTVKQFFGQRLLKIKKWQDCWYTMSKSEDFLIDWFDEGQRILIVSACSGHSFKFSPLIGKISSDLVIKDKSIQLFEKNRYLFRLQYHKGVNLE